MKIDFRSIIIDHVATLHDDKRNCVAASDIIIFYTFPIILSVLAHFVDVPIDRDVYNVSITFYGIFVALLLNIQVAIFGIFQRKIDPPADKKLASLFNDRLKKRQKLLGELNSNLSYMMLVCCLALVTFLILYTFKFVSRFSVSVTVLIYSHFLLTLMMTVKRTHVLFQKEYRA